MSLSLSLSLVVAAGTGGTVAEPVHLRKYRHHKTPTPAERPGPNEQLPPPDCAVLAGVTIAGGLIPDPNGDPNDPQQFRAFDPAALACDSPVGSTTTAPAAGTVSIPRFTG